MLGATCGVPLSVLEAVDIAAASAHEAATEETEMNRKSQVPRSQRRGCLGGESGKGSLEKRREER